MKSYLLLSLLAVALATTACSRPKVQTYKAKRDAPPAAAAPHQHDLAGMPAGQDPHAGLGIAPASGAPTGMPAMGGMPGGMGMSPHGGGEAPASPLAWTAPATWTLGAPSAMRLATFDIADSAGKAQVTVVALGGDAGGGLANINRWRGQLQLQPLTEAQAGDATQPLTLPVGTGKLVTISGPDAAAPAMLVAMFPYQGQTWFVKLMGPGTVVTGHKQEFVELLNSLRPTAGEQK